MAKAYYLYLFLLLLATTISCKKSAPDAPGTGSMHVKYLHNETGIMYGNSTLMYFSYLNGKLSRRAGGYLPIPGGAGQYPYIFSTDVYDTLVYNGNNVTITSHYSGSGFTPPPKPRYILLENGRISRVTQENDTAYYHYTTNISRIERFLPGAKIIKEFKFDNNGNLQQVKSITFSRATGDTSRIREETFSQFDDKPNPLKSLALLENVYYRTLSRNNYTYYSFSERIGPVETGSRSEGWVAYTLSYNSNGVPDFTK